MLATLLNIPAGVYFFIAENLSKLLSSACNSSFSTPLASPILLFKESVISCKASSTSLLKSLAIRVTLSLLVFGSKSRSTFCCSSTEVTLGVSKELLSLSFIASSSGLEEIEDKNLFLKACSSDISFPDLSLNIKLAVE